MDERSSLGYATSEPRWLQHCLPHFILHYRPASCAQRDLTLIASRLEVLRSSAIQALDPGDGLNDPFHVVLTDTADDELDADEDFGPEKHRVTVVYSPDSPGEGLERGLIQVILARLIGDSAGEAMAIVDGLLGHLAGEADRNDTEELNAEIIELRNRGHFIPLAELLGEPSLSANAAYYQEAASFVSFLLSTYGAEQFKLFAGGLAPGNASRAAETALGKPLSVVEKQWLGMLGEARLPLVGMADFLRRSLSYMLPYRAQFSVLVLAILTSLTWPTLGPFLFERLIDEAVLEHHTSLLTPLAVMAAILLVARFAGQFGSEYLGAALGHKAANQLRLRCFGHLQELSVDFFARKQIGDLVARLSSDIERLEDSLTTVLPRALPALMLIVFNLILCFTIEWRLALLALVLMVVIFAVPSRLHEKIDKASYKRQEDTGRVAGALQEHLSAVPLVQAFGLQKRVFEQVASLVLNLTRSSLRMAFLGSIYGTSLGAGGLAMELVIIWVGALMILQGELSVGFYYAFLLLLYDAATSIEMLSKYVEPLHKATGAMHRVEELLEARSDIVDSPGALPIARVEREIRFDNVTFSYTGAQVSLEDLNLTIPFGSSVSFVGPSGSGKSTIVNLLLRFYDPTVGSLSIDGHDIREFTLESLRQQISVVMQENVLFNTSVRENIRMGRLQATDDEVEAAAKAAEIHEFILGLPEGYDTVVGERGGRLSGGQRQRLAIARALVRKPGILILDEATSALDPQTEAAINSTLSRLTPGCTVIFVTHRLASVTNAERLFVLDAGRLVDEGAHQELLARQGLYRRLWEQGRVEAAAAASGTAVDAARLRTIPLFRNFDEEHLAGLASQFVPEQYQAGEVIFEEGDPADKMYLIARGQVEVEAVGPTGQRRRLAVLGPGEYFGEMALRQEAPRSSTVRTRAPTLLLALERKHILKGMADILSLPEGERQLVSWILRRQPVSLAEVADYLGAEQEAARDRLEGLVQRGYVLESVTEGETRYLSRLEHKREARLSKSIWDALG